MKIGWAFAATAAALLAGVSTARAHELACDKRVRLSSETGPGTTLLTIGTYPAQVTYFWTVFNVHPTDTSVLVSVSDTLFEPTPVEVNVAIPVGETYSATDTITIESFEACQQYATSQGAGGAVSVDNRLTATWDMGEAQCTARVVCQPPSPPPPPGATRTLGFFSTHVDAAQACLGDPADEIELFLDGTIGTIDTLEELLSVLWTRPSSFSGLEKDRFLLARQTLVAICNERLFGTTSADVDAALAALEACDADLGTLISAVDAFNNSGDDVPFPVGFEPGSATPIAAQEIAAGYTLTESDLSCTP